MRLQISELGDAVLDHVAGLIHRIFDRAEEASATPATPAAAAPAPPPADPGAPDLRYLREHFADAVGSFYATLQRIIADNPVDAQRFAALAAKAGAGTLGADEAAAFDALKLAAQRHGEADIPPPGLRPAIALQEFVLRR